MDTAGLKGLDLHVGFDSHSFSNLLHEHTVAHKPVSFWT